MGGSRNLRNRRRDVALFFSLKFVLLFCIFLNLNKIKYYTKCLFMGIIAFLKQIQRVGGVASCHAGAFGRRCCWNAEVLQED